MADDKLLIENSSFFSEVAQMLSSGRSVTMPAVGNSMTPIIATYCLCACPTAGTWCIACMPERATGSRLWATATGKPRNNASTMT